MEFTLYSDFANAECYALNEQMLSLGVGAAVKWRGVQLQPKQLEPMRPFDRRERDQCSDEIEMVRLVHPALAVELPRGRPNTRRAIIAVISVLLKAPTRAPLFRDAIFRAYWRDSVDISVMAELQRIADSVAVPRMVLLDHPDADEIADDWDLDWATERMGGVPRVIRSDGKILWGFRPLADATAFFLG